MSSKTYTTEAITRIYNDEHGDFIEVGPDRDGLDLCEIRYSDGSPGEFSHYITMPWKQAQILGHILINAVGPLPEVSK